MNLAFLRLLAVCVGALALLTACPSVPRSGQLEKPSLSSLEILQSNGGNWMTVSGPAPLEILPTHGRVLRVRYRAPIGSSFDVALRTPGGQLTALPQNHGAQLPSDAGYFQVLNVNPNLTPPMYTMELRPPVTLPDPANFDVLIVNKSLRTDVQDSEPLVVRLAQRREFTVTVQIQGGGRVTSNPPGIACGTSISGQPLTQCSYAFGPYAVTLNPGSSSGNRFLGWEGNCPSATQPCTITLNGTAVQAVAKFGTSPAAGVNQCAAAPLLPGLRWIATPQCDPGSFPTTSSALCDSAGLFCCKNPPVGGGTPGLPSPRCGVDKIEFAPDCRNTLGRGMLRQPGGCYEIAPGP